MRLSRPTVMEVGPLAQKRAILWDRMRVQLGGALLFAVILPIFLVRVFLRDPSLSNLFDQNLIAVSLAAGASVFLWRNITDFPGIRAGTFVLPAVLVAYGIVFTAYLFLRVDNSRAALMGSIVALLVWLYFVCFMSTRSRTVRFGVVPHGDVAALRSVPDIHWIWLNEPRLARGGCDAIVADFRHDLSVAWEAFLADCALRGIPVMHVKQLRESLTGRVEIEHLSENNFGSLVPFMAYLRMRGFVDLVAAVIASILLAPLFAIVALAIKLESPGPVFFRQRRVGYRGEPFIVFKFRTMRADRRESEDLDHAVTKENDQRITRLGRFLRRSRIDELPQIFNILKGEMSWIGPRPEAEVLSRWYESELPFYRYRHIVPPGITGWAQVSQGHVADLEQVNYKLQYDFYYIKNFSPWLDALIVARTIQTILSGFGSR